MDWSLVDGALPVALSLAGAAALLALLLLGGDRRWFTRVLPLVVAGTAVLVGIGWVAVSVLQPFPDPLPAVVWWSIGGGLLAAGLAAAAARRPGLARRAAAALAAVLVLAAAGNAVNLHFGQFPTLGAALGLPPANQVDFARVSGGVADVVTRLPGGALSQVWQPPPGMPTSGTVSEVAIPAPASGFAARPAWVYLPPAHQAVPRAQLPVLVLLSGQPGSPRDWLDGGGLSATMDRFAAAHGGLAPVVVMPDWLGTPLNNTLCLDSRLGAVQTYLTVDVPAWVRATLQVDPAPAAWAVGGLSAGGTCALQLAVNAPEVFPTFLDVSGQSEPTLGDRTRTVAAAFGGDAAAFTAVNPLDLLATRGYPGSAGTVVVGGDDALYRPQAQQVTDAARRAGMQIEYRELPGGHDWRVWAPGLETSLPWLATRIGLTP